MTYLVYCGITGKPPKAELLDGVPVADIISAAKRHSLGALVHCALDSVGLSTRETAIEYNSAIRREMLLDNERGHITAWLEEKGIKYMPLKGIVLKQYYPGIGLRQMADNDILFDHRYRKEVRDFFVSRGYEIECYNAGNHDIYLKHPVYNYEMHVALFGSSYTHKVREYYRGLLFRAIPDKEGSFAHHINDDDRYVYLKCHEFKHYNRGGMGIRFFLDTYVFLNAVGDKLDFDYIHGECTKLGFGAYEKLTREMAMKIFDEDFLERLCAYSGAGEGDPFTAEERELFDFSSYSGTYGILEHYVANDISHIISNDGVSEGHAKIKYFFKRLVLPMEMYEQAYPFLFRHKWLIPFHAVWRLIAAVFTKPKKVFTQIKLLLKFKPNK